MKQEIKNSKNAVWRIYCIKTKETYCVTLKKYWKGKIIVLDKLNKTINTCIKLCYLCTPLGNIPLIGDILFSCTCFVLIIIEIINFN